MQCILSKINIVNALLRYYGLWMWFPELFKRAEDGGSPCANTSRIQSSENESCYPVKTAGIVSSSQILRKLDDYVLYCDNTSFFIFCSVHGRFHNRSFKPSRKHFHYPAHGQIGRKNLALLVQRTFNWFCHLMICSSFI